MRRIPEATIRALSSDEVFSAWRAIPAIAERAWRAEGDGIAWHHLLMSVGNFKRQTQIRYDMPTEGLRRPSPRPKVYALPGGQTIGVRDPESWKQVDAIEGVGVATMSALLAALWPSEHAVFDTRTRNAFVALQLLNGEESAILELAGVSPGTRGRSSRLGKLKIPQYAIYREALVNEVRRREEVTLLQLERTMYEIERRVPRSDTRSWDGFADAFGRQLDEANAENA